MTMPVLEFKREGWRDVVGCLREIANQIESGQLDKPEVCCVVTMGADGYVDTFGAGEKAEGIQVLGLLRLGEQSVIDSIMPGE